MNYFKIVPEEDINGKKTGLFKVVKVSFVFKDWATKGAPPSCIITHGGGHLLHRVSQHKQRLYRQQ